ncbi:MAG: hypothetical protein IJ760_05395 [Bacteroidales bacterium]|nr:hypothetical protein [Bacteroidales bacterium]
MKKTVLTIVAIIGAACAMAQENDGLVYPNTFYASASVGGTAYSHSGTASFGAPSVDITGGVWLASPLAFQLAADGIMAPASNGNDALFFAFSAEFKWDVNSTFFHIYNKRFLSPIPFYPVVGLGPMLRVNTTGTGALDYSLDISLGLQAPMRINDHMDAVLQYKCFLLPQGFDNSHGDNYIHTLGLGVQLRQGADPYHRRTERYTRSIAEDWFMGVGIGPNYSAFDIFTNPNRGGLSMVGISPELMVGRNFSSFWALRLSLCGLSAHEHYDTVNEAAGASYRYSFFHADLMLNISNLILRGRGVRFNALPYLGAGPIWRYDMMKFEVAANAGVTLRYFISRKSDIYMDMRYVMVTPSLAGGLGPSGHSYGCGLPSVTFGYIYNFGHNTTRYRIPLDKLVK